MTKDNKEEIDILCDAISHKKLKEVKRLVQNDVNDVNVNQINKKGFTPEASPILTYATNLYTISSTHFQSLTHDSLR